MNNINSNSIEEKTSKYSNPTYNDYLKAIAFGLLFSTISGVIIGLVVWGLEAIFEFIIFVTIIISAMLPRAFLRKPHQLGTMVICAIVAFMNPFTIYLTMETASIEFEDTSFISFLMILAPILGLFLGYKKWENLSYQKYQKV